MGPRAHRGKHSAFVTALAGRGDLPFNGGDLQRGKMRSTRTCRVTVIGATGTTGPYVVRGLIEAGHSVTALGRDADRLSKCDERAARAVADIADARALATALAGAEIAVMLAPAAHLAAMLDALPDSCGYAVAAGSIRKYSRFGDEAARAARGAEAALRASGREGIMLDFSMIWGQPEDRTVNRILAMVRRWPAVPLPDGGRHTVQPLFIDDMVASIVAALERRPSGAPIDVAGPQPIAYREMVRACAALVGRKVPVVPVPALPFVACERAAGWFGGSLPVIGEFARMAEDKRIDVGGMTRRLGIEPIPFEEGLRRKEARGWLVAA
jgi:nucleoside-diphosphate-sugar epimerase